MLEFYIVVAADGTVTRRRTGIRAYSSYKRAENAARYEGDSVVKITVSHETPPLFIRRKKLE